MRILYPGGLDVEGNMGNAAVVYQEDYYSVFVQFVADCVTSKLNINWEDKNVFCKLLVSSIKDDLKGKNGLLEQFLHSQLAILAETFRREFKLDKKIGINYNYAVHSKFNDIIAALKEQIGKEKGPKKIPVKKSKKNSKTEERKQ